MFRGCLESRKSSQLFYTAQYYKLVSALQSEQYTTRSTLSFRQSVEVFEVKTVAHREDIKHLHVGYQPKNTQCALQVMAKT